MSKLRFLIVNVLVGLAFGNVEKVIFTAPASTQLPTDASIDNLLLTPLNPQHSSVRTYVNATFPTDTSAKGIESWFLLEGLNPGQRYEVRICWLATQPTAFWLYTHSLSDTFQTPSLISSLTTFAYARHAILRKDQIDALQTRRPTNDKAKTPTTLLFLQVYAGADYFSLNETLMKNVPPVLVDIILDPYLLNIFPQSLVPTALYITGVAVVAWFLSAWIAVQLRRLSSSSPPDQSPARPRNTESKKRM